MFRNNARSINSVKWLKVVNWLIMKIVWPSWHLRSVFKTNLMPKYKNLLIEWSNIVQNIELATKAKRSLLIPIVWTIGGARHTALTSPMCQLLIETTYFGRSIKNW